MEGAQVVATTVASRVEVGAALRKAVRVGILSEAQAEPLVRAFTKKWPSLVRTRVTERLVKHATALAWSHGLRVYDAIHLASAAAWQQALGLPVAWRRSINNSGTRLKRSASWHIHRTCPTFLKVGQKKTGRRTRLVRRRELIVEMDHNDRERNSGIEPANRYQAEDALTEHAVVFIEFVFS